MTKRNAFTLLELIFVIVVMGIIGKFGVEFLAQAYKSFIFSKINHTLQSNSATTVEFVASRLQHRIKDSVIARTAAGATPVSLASSSGDTYTVLEWVASDIENFRADSLPNWSGIVDLDAGSSTLIVSPETNTTAIDNLISILSYGHSGVDDSALYFIGSNSDTTTDYGWSGNTAYMQDQNGSMHPIQDRGNITEFEPKNLTAGFKDVYEYYKLAWTANAVVMEDYNTTGDMTGNLYFYTNYQPWNGDQYHETGKNIQKSLLMENVSTFQAMAIGSVIKIQVCAKSNLTNEEHSLCKEKTIF